MHCNFNPEIALRQLEEEEQEKDKKEEQCPVPDNLKSCPCQGTCNCKRKQGKQPEKVEELKQGRSVS